MNWNLLIISLKTHYVEVGRMKATEYVQLGLLLYFACVSLVYAFVLDNELSLFIAITSVLAISSTIAYYSDEKLK
jgi:hypothetical protein